MAALQLGQHFLERNVELDEEDEGVYEEVGDFGDLAFAGFVEGGDDDFERLLADFLGDAGGASGEEFGGVAAFRAADAALAKGGFELEKEIGDEFFFYILYILLFLLLLFGFSFRFSDAALLVIGLFNFFRIDMKGLFA